VRSPRLANAVVHAQFNEPILEQPLGPLGKAIEALLRIREARQPVAGERGRPVSAGGEQSRRTMADQGRELARREPLSHQSPDRRIDGQVLHRPPAARDEHSDVVAEPYVLEPDWLRQLGRVAHRLLHALRAFRSAVEVGCEAEGVGSRRDAAGRGRDDLVAGILERLVGADRLLRPIAGRVLRAICKRPVTAAVSMNRIFDINFSFGSPVVVCSTEAARDGE
jgi:hypothetical protein